MPNDEKKGSPLPSRWTAKRAMWWDVEQPGPFAWWLRRERELNRPPVQKIRAWKKHSFFSFVCEKWPPESAILCSSFHSCDLVSATNFGRLTASRGVNIQVKKFQPLTTSPQLAATMWLEAWTAEESLVNGQSSFFTVSYVQKNSAAVNVKHTQITLSGHVVREHQQRLSQNPQETHRPFGTEPTAAEGRPE